MQGTVLNEDEQLVTSGGRVMAITARSPQLDDALDTIYAQIGEHVAFERMHYRTDIGRASIESIV